jgi:aspartyl-tRNA(Asn)/glutamyl-tRNA(Gln) amidotransferase subunit C|tara:strand:- start:33 stop:317 length:285 start_codon:yes stop_codon:yes gene_type:complete
MPEKIDIKNVAKLAAIKLNEEEEKQLQNDLSMIIDHFAALSEMDLPDSKISIHPLGMPLNLSEDIASKFLTHEEALSNAPESKDGQFVVPPSLD